MRAAITDAELHVYYGFWPYAMWAEQPHLVSLKKPLEPMLKQPGVYYHGMVSERDLAKGYASAGGNLSLTAGSFTECSHLSSPPNPPPLHVPPDATRCFQFRNAKRKPKQNRPHSVIRMVGAGTFCAKMGWERAPFVLKPGRLPLRLLCLPLG